MSHSLSGLKTADLAKSSAWLPGSRAAILLVAVSHTWTVESSQAAAAAHVPSGLRAIDITLDRSGRTICVAGSSIFTITARPRLDSTNPSRRPLASHAHRFQDEFG